MVSIAFIDTVRCVCERRRRKRGGEKSLQTNKHTTETGHPMAGTSVKEMRFICIDILCI